MQTITTSTDFIRFCFTIGNNAADIKLRTVVANGDQNTKLAKNGKTQEFIGCGISASPYRLAWREYSASADHWQGEIVESLEQAEGVTVVNSCPMASDGCAMACLDHQGLASVFDHIRYARMIRTIAFHRYRNWYLDKVRADISRWQRRAEKQGKRLCCRLNVFSDIPWESFNVIQQFPNVEFYDYTAIPNRAGRLLPNYWVTLSRKENNDSAVLSALADCKNVAVVFHDSKPMVGNRSKLQRLPKRWNGFDVIDGDTTDLRFTDPRGRKRGRVIGLRLKAHSKAERISAIESGFAVPSGF